MYWAEKTFANVDFDPRRQKAEATVEDVEKEGLEVVSSTRDWFSTTSSLLEHPPYRQVSSMNTLDTPMKHLQLSHDITDLWEMDSHSIVALDHYLVDTSTNKLAILWVRPRSRAVTTLAQIHTSSTEQLTQSSQRQLSCQQECHMYHHPAH